MSTQTIPATKARKQFFQLITENSQPGMSTTISVDGVPKVVMLSYDDFNGWMETFEILADDKLTKEIKKGKDEIKKGETILLSKLLADTEI